MTAYLDNNATTRPLPEVIDAVRAALSDHWHNPSSVHRPGQAARHAVELARADLARLLNAKPAEIVFTSGASESVALAIRGSLRPAHATPRTIVTTPIEHECARETISDLERCGVARCVTLPIGPDGAVKPEDAARLISPETALVSVMWANNETGVIQPVQAIGRLCRDRGIPFHTDAAQVAGRLPIDLSDANDWCDLLSLSAHKFHGPKGVGALWIRRGITIVPQNPGTQEKSRRGGTENVPGILGMGVAATIAHEWIENANDAARIAALRDRFENELTRLVPGARINAHHSPRLFNTTSIAFPGLEAEALLLLLSERAVCASAGAACSSGSLDPSPVLLAMGLEEPVAHGTLRFSLSRLTTEAEIEHALGVIPLCVTRLRDSATSVRA